MISVILPPRNLFQILYLALAVLGLPLASAAEEGVSLLESGQPSMGWTFDNGQEFPGAKGSLVAAESSAPEGGDVLRLYGDFSEGGVYVQMLRDVSAGEIVGIVFKVKATNTDRMTVRLIDGSGQCHQTRPIMLGTDSWQEVKIDIADLAGGEHWGGEDDGVWHGALSKVGVLLMNKGGLPDSSVEFSDIRTVPVTK